MQHSTHRSDNRRVPVSPVYEARKAPEAWGLEKTTRPVGSKEGSLLGIKKSGFLTCRGYR